MERQASLLEAGAFVMSAETAASMLEQLQRILRQQHMLDDAPGRERPSASSGGTEGEQRLLAWLRSSRPQLHRDPSSGKEGRLYSTPLWGEPGNEQSPRAQAMLSEEVRWLAGHIEGTRIIMRSEPWGYDLLVSLEGRRGQSLQVSVQLPLSYPSDRLCLRSLSGADSVVEDIHRGCLRIFAPISLTAIVRIIRHAMLEGEAAGNR